MYQALSYYRSRFWLRKDTNLKQLQMGKKKVHNLQRIRRLNGTLITIHYDMPSYKQEKTRLYVSIEKYLNLRHGCPRLLGKFVKNNKNIERFNNILLSFAYNKVNEKFAIYKGAFVRKFFSIKVKKDQRNQEFSKKNEWSTMNKNESSSHSLSEQNAVKTSLQGDAYSAIHDPENATILLPQGTYSTKAPLHRLLEIENKDLYPNNVIDQITENKACILEERKETMPSTPNSKKESPTNDELKYDENHSSERDTKMSKKIALKPGSNGGVIAQSDEKGSLMNCYQNTNCSSLNSVRKLASERIHIIGMGPTGQYIAHNISQLNHAPPITLVMHRPFVIQRWYEEGAAIRILKNDKIFTQTDFHVESSVSYLKFYPFRRYYGHDHLADSKNIYKPPSYLINCLIVATACSVTIAALESIRHRIGPTTTICIVEKGMGMVHKLNKLFFTDISKRPSYILGNLTHNLEPTDNLFTHVQKGSTEFFCSKLPRNYVSKLDSGTVIERKDFSWSPEAKHIVETLLRIPDFNTATLGHKDFHLRQLSKLVICTIIESLAVAFDCVNGQLLYNYGVTNLMRILLQEISLIVTSLPELRNIKNIEATFNPESLEKNIVCHLQRSEVTVSPMLVDLKAGKRTAIDFYTGYFVDRANMLQIPCPANQMMYNLVRGKQTMRRRENDNFIPFV